VYNSSGNLTERSLPSLVRKLDNKTNIFSLSMVYRKAVTMKREEAIKDGKKTIVIMYFHL
jgi:hypothetical protein